MSKIGYISIVMGFIILVGYGLIQLLISPAPAIIKLGLVLIVCGIIIIIFKQIDDRSVEKKEEDEYKKY